MPIFPMHFIRKHYLDLINIISYLGLGGQVPKIESFVAENVVEVDGIVPHESSSSKSTSPTSSSSSAASTAPELLVEPRISESA